MSERLKKSGDRLTPEQENRCLEILGLEPGASPREIRTAFRRKAGQTHPDHGGNRKEFEEVKDAYNRLSNNSNIGFEETPKSPRGGIMGTIQSLLGRKDLSSLNNQGEFSGAEGREAPGSAPIEYKYYDMDPKPVGPPDPDSSWVDRDPRV